MKSYPTLAEMGVLHPKQIKHYAVNGIDYIDYKDLELQRRESEPD